MRNRPAAWATCVALAAALASVSWAGEEGAVIWRIGRTDRDYAEFAAAGNYAEYPKRFSSGPVFRVGKDDPAKAWPFIHPGPGDPWAGGRRHSFTVQFDLDRTEFSFFTLVIDLVSTHGSIPPELDVNVNGSSWKIVTERGPGDGALTGASTGKPRTYPVIMGSSVLKPKGNRIAITTTSGSWILYDALRLCGYKDVPAITGLKAKVLPHWYHHKNGPSRVVRLDLAGGFLAEPARVETVFAGRRFVQEVDPGGKMLGTIEVYLAIENPEEPTPARLALKTRKKTLRADVTIGPQRKWEVHLVHQTHLDIGFTHTQEEVLRRQVDYLKQVLKLIEKTKNYPEDARFRWHPEGMWAVDEFLLHATPEEKRKFIEAAKSGAIHQDILYAQAMTGVYSEEELFELMGSAKRFEKTYGVPVVSAMQTDVPGYTWGLASALAHHGAHYISAGPNSGHRTGHVFHWGDYPFYWVSPSGKHKVLMWVSAKGYSWFFGRRRGLNEGRIIGYLGDLERRRYPYDILQIRYAIGGDNGPPDPNLPAAVKAWNERYAHPRIIISTNSEALKALERRYRDKIPVMSGDYTPYWEDGVASTSADTAVNRRACERIVQAQALWAMLDPKAFPCDEFDRAWIKMIMYDEHTWGAHCSISRPDSAFSVKQAEYKQRFALDGARMTDDLVEKVVGGKKRTGSNTIDVYNTTSWARERELVVLSKEQSRAGDLVKDAGGRPVPSQRLASGGLAFFVENARPFSATRFTLLRGKSRAAGGARANGLKLENALVSLAIDPQSGAIKSLRHRDIAADLVDGGKGQGINDYLYILGRDARKGHQRIKGPAKVTVEDAGPLVATLSIETDAPGCRKLIRKIRLVSGSDLVDCVNIVEKLKERKPEGVYFAYPFNIPGGVSRLDVPWAVVQPEKDQLKGANRNYYCVQRWVDISGANYGVTWITIDAPMLQFDPIKIAGPRNLRDWRTTIEPGQTFYSWVMNNHWECNYKAYQEGIIVYRYVLKPHAHAYDRVKAQRTARSVHQPLLAFSANPMRPPVESMLAVEGDGVVVTSIKPSRDGRALMVRLFNTAERARNASLRWARRPRKTWLSNPMEEEVAAAGESIPMVPHEIVTVRVVR